jgi:hypothetical protein
MNNLATQNKNDFTVTENGDAYISQRKLAELLGVNENTLKSYVLRTHKDVNTINGLSASLLQKCTHYFAIESSVKTEQALMVMSKLSEAGAKAFIYHEAGYTMTAVQKPMSQLQMIAKMALEQDAANERITILESSVARLTGVSNCMAILAWATNNGLTIPVSKAAQMGKQASSYCKTMGIEIGTVKDERYGKINTYPESVLDRLFSEME